MSLKPRLVVVDHSTETADVLQAVFAPRGVTVERHRGLSRRSGAPRDAEVFVLDDETVDFNALPTTAADLPANRVVLGTPHPAVNETANYLPKPFQYEELIRVLETLLAERELNKSVAPERRAA